MKKRAIVLVSLLFLLNLWFVSAATFEFNGTVHDVDGAALNGSNVSVTMRGPTFNVVGFESNLTGTDGWFTIDLTADATYMYQPSITHYNETDSIVVEYIGASLPAFPYSEFVGTARTNFYLKQAGTINVTAVNSTGDRINFNYQIKDTKLGYPIGEGWTSTVTEAVIYVPTDRNYSLMVYPQNSLPVGFEWSNFSSTDSYTVNDGSVYYTYNGTTRTVEKQFNCSETLARLTGYVNVTGLDGWEELIVVSYLLESGNMTHATYGTLPYNMSSWMIGGTGPLGQSDEYDITTGFYNITLPEPAESASYLLFATAKNGTYYGGFKHITLSYGETLPETNFTHVYGLLGDDYSNITLHSAQDWSEYNASTVKQQLSFVNSSNDSISGLSGHIEVKVDYSSYDAMEVAYMVDVSQTGSASFSLPLLNVTGIKKMNVFSQMYAPRKLTLTVDQIQANNNITLTTFNPGQIDATEDKGGADTSIVFYISNSTCDVPQPDSSCVIGNLDEDNFNPISAVMGGGKISFRMGYGDVKIHYVNVDLLASGPPDAAFDDAPNQTATGTTFDAALRFGSGGPTIYDYILVSVPYSETAGSGLDDSKGVNMSLPVLYDDDWNVIWNSTENGTAGSDLAANQSYYSTYQTDWESLMNVSACVTNYSSEWFNTTSPCYIDTANNTVWIRLPHFSGTGPSVTGTTTAASTTTPTSSGSSSAAQGGYAPVDVSEGIVRTMSIKDAVVISLGGSGGGSAGGSTSHQIVLNKLTSDSVTLLIYSNPLEVTLKVGESKKVDVDGDNILDIFIELRSIDVPHKKADIYFKDVTPKKEEAPVEEVKEEEKKEEKPEVPTEKAPSVPEEVPKGKSWLWVIVAVVLVAMGVGYWFMKKK